MQVLVIGASGFIGRHLMRHLAGAQHGVVAGTFLSRDPANDGNSWYQVEVTDPAGLENVFRAVRPEVVVHLAALADVATAEREPQRATAVNVDGSTFVAGLTEQHRAKLVYISTEYVFPGETGYYPEDAIPHPTTQYGTTKLEAEREIARLCSRWSVLRTSIVYGWPEPGQRNFAPWLLTSLRSGNTYRARTDVYRTPVYVEHLVEGIAALAAGDYYGTFHLAGKDWVSMYDFARSFAREFDLDINLIVPTSATTGGTESSHPEQREHGVNQDLLGLDSTRTTNALGLPYFGLADGIRAFKAAAFLN
ncbi:MAG: SDR family oxidoreductase [Dehalococcoidia bacterium]|nr:SDR family oxidoreductase [Dehalococcoidia bacterium]